MTEETIASKNQLLDMLTMSVEMLLDTEHLDMDDAMRFNVRALNSAGVGQNDSALSLSLISYSIMRHYTGRETVHVYEDNVAGDNNCISPRRAIADLIIGCAQYIAHDEEGDVAYCCEQDVATSLSKYATWVVSRHSQEAILHAVSVATERQEEFDA